MLCIQEGASLSNEFGNRLYELRVKSNLNQEQLANKVNVSRQAVSKWERGESLPDMNNLIALSNLYEVSIDYLVKGERAPLASLQHDGSTGEEASKNEMSSCDEHRSAQECSPNQSYSDLRISDPFLAAPSYPAPDDRDRVVFPQNQPYYASPSQPQSQYAPQPQYQPPYQPQPQLPKKPKNPWMTFPYPILIVILFLFLGFGFSAWNPAWVLFLTIPFYYWIASVIGNDPGTGNDE